MSAVVNQVRRAFYMDSVALMRISRTVSGLASVDQAAAMIGSATNKKLMQEAGLLTAEGESAGPNDLVIAVRADDSQAAEAALKHAAGLLQVPTASQAGGPAATWRPKTIDTALQQLPQANLALISVPGEFAGAEAHRALAKGLHVMMFSDNVPLDQEVELKEEARRRGLLMMGPDCGTAIISGVPLAFANVIPRGNIGIIAASGTGTQEVSSLLARSGFGVSHAIGVGGRDLKAAVGGIMTLLAIEALDRDPNTKHIIIISKPPEPAVAKTVLERVGRSQKPFTICFLGLEESSAPANATFAADLRSAAESATGGKRIIWDGASEATASVKRLPNPQVRGLFSGGTMCAEAQLFFRRFGIPVSSNAPIPGVAKPAPDDTNVLLDLGEDEYTVGRPHPMIDPSLRDEMLREALRAGKPTIVLLDVVLGYGAHPDPAVDLAKIAAEGADNAMIIASVCGTRDDPQDYAAQVEKLRRAGIVVAPSNAHAAEFAVEVIRRA